CYKNYTELPIVLSNPMHVYVPFDIQLSLDDQIIMVKNAFVYSECNEKELDIEKGKLLETYRCDSLFCKLKKQISFDMGGKYMQLLMTYCIILHNFSTPEKNADEKVLERPKTRKYKRTRLINNSRKVALLLSLL
nr:hypothetical protein [Tanacetum cinerariifolium]